MKLFISLDWASVRQHYDLRVKMHNRLVDLHREANIDGFSRTALTDADSNYSAIEHGLGPKILGANNNAENQVFVLANKFIGLQNARTVPELIFRAKIKYLQISVGSEISCMVNPNVCWVANTRTIWTHLVVKHGDNLAKADEELKLYRDADVTSEMAYHMWSAIHAELDVALTRIAKLSQQYSVEAGVDPGVVIYLWADAIASHFYDRYHS